MFCEPILTAPQAQGQLGARPALRRGDRVGLAARQGIERGARLGRRLRHLEGLGARGEHRSLSQHIERGVPVTGADRKSTRLNSSHLVISYAVFCLKKKKDRETESYSI